MQAVQNSHVFYESMVLIDSWPQVWLGITDHRLVIAYESRTVLVRGGGLVSYHARRGWQWLIIQTGNLYANLLIPLSVVVFV